MSSARTTIDKLRRYKLMRLAEEDPMGWWVNPNEHPLPSLPTKPDQIEWLRGEYIKTIRLSAPALLPEVIELVDYYLRDILPSDYDDTH